MWGGVNHFDPGHGSYSPVKLIMPTVPLNANTDAILRFDPTIFNSNLPVDVAGDKIFIFHYELKFEDMNQSDFLNAELEPFPFVVKLVSHM